MSGGRRWITLSEALSWMAFGNLHNKDQLLSHLAKASYCTEKLEALEDSLEKLTSKGLDGAITFKGRYEPEAAETGSSAHTEEMPGHRLADYRAFDITTDGLRYGTGLMWLPDAGHEEHNDLRYTYKTSQRPEHYADVSVDFVALKKEFRSGKLPRLADSDLDRWWKRLSDSDKKRSGDQHKEMVKAAFPNNHVSRERLRNLRKEIARKRGRPTNSP